MRTTNRHKSIVSILLAMGIISVALGVIARVAPGAWGLPDSATSEMETVARASVPPVATFYVLEDDAAQTGRLLAPLPYLPAQGVVYTTGFPDVFLVDTRAVAQADTALLAAFDSIKAQCSTAGTSESALTKALSANSLELEAGLLEGETMSLNTLDTGGADTLAISYGSNLFLEITGVSNSVVFFNLHNATNQVYEIKSKADMTGSVWNTETALWPTNQEVMPFTLPVLERTNALFVWARDWTEVDENTNTIPDWWEWRHFGNLAQPAYGDYDGDGTSNGQEYTNHTDPNTIVFSVSVTNLYVNNPSLPIQFNVLRGVPASVAIVVDSTNLALASWADYSSNHMANLGTMAEGWHQLWIGLRGRLASSPASWDCLRVKLDTTPPTLVVTNPEQTTLSQPMIQLQGYSPESLAGISCVVSNADGGSTSALAALLDQFCDTNTWELTTNYFQAFDLDLTNGLNTVTLRARDLAGNETVTNLSITMDYSSDTNPPAIRLDWPQDGMKVCGSAVTWRGWVDDPTADLKVVVTDISGGTNVVAALIEREGTFWAENLPLNGGTNVLFLSATDAAGNTSTTNICVINLSGALTINALSQGQLQKAMAESVSGTIGLGDYTVWINGVRAIQTNGTWSAANVALEPGGTAVFQAVAIPDTDNGGNGNPAGSSSGLSAAARNPTAVHSISTEWEGDRPSFVYQAVYSGRYDYRCVDLQEPFGQGYWREKTDFHSGMDSTDYGGGSYSVGGTCLGVDEEYRFDYDWLAEMSPVDERWTHDYSGPGTNYSYSYVENGSPLVLMGPWASPMWGMENNECWYVPTGGETVWHESWNRIIGEGTDYEVFTHHLITRLKLWTGGKNLPGRKGLFRLDGDVIRWVRLESTPEKYWTWDEPPATRMGKPPGSYVELPEGRGINLAIQTASTTFAGGADVPKFKLNIMIGTNVVTDSNLPAVVGQRIELRAVLENLSEAPGPTPEEIRYEWTVPGYAVAGYNPTANSATLDTNIITTNASVGFYWVDGGNKKVECKVTIKGDEMPPIKTTFDVIRPLPEFRAEIREGVRVDRNHFINGIFSGLTFLHFGINTPGTNSDVGIAFVYDDAPIDPSSSNTYGRYFITQVANSWCQRYNLSDGTNCTGYEMSGLNGLDGGNPYGTGYSEASHGEWTDSPSAVLSTAKWLAHANSFSTFLFFRPRPYDASTIEVPMFKLTWDWFGSATNGPWGKKSGAASADQPHLTVEFPYWTHTISGFNTTNASPTNCLNENE